MSDSAIVLRDDLVALVVYRKRRVIFTDSAWRAGVMGFVHSFIRSFIRSFVRSQASRGVKTVLVR